MEIKKSSRDINKKVKRLNSIRGTQRFTRPSQSSDSANVVINSQVAIQKLHQLSENYMG